MAWAVANRDQRILVDKQFRATGYAAAPADLARYVAYAPAAPTPRSREPGRFQSRPGRCAGGFRPGRGSFHAAAGWRQLLIQEGLISSLTCLCPLTSLYSCNHYNLSLLSSMKTTFIPYVLAAGLLALGAPAMAQTKVKTKSSAGKQKTVAAPTSSVGVSRAYLDTSVQPCDNFYQYANGGWLKNNPIPAIESSWGSFNVLADNNRSILHRILDKSAANRAAQPGSNAQKVGDYYGAAMDTVAIEKAGLTYLQPHLAKIEAAPDLAAMQRLLADPKTHVGSAWYGFSLLPDLKQSDRYSIYFGQGGLTLPDRDYYLTDDARSKAIRTAYQA
nr:hypothetical protein [Tanacetum cinerariifolium]